MGLVQIVPLLVALLVLVAPGGDAVEVVQESRSPDTGRKGAVRHVALIENTSARTVHGLRVRVELYDYFGKLLWAGTVVPSPTSLSPGDTASLSFTTPAFDAYRRTTYRFEYRRPPASR